MKLKLSKKVQSLILPTEGEAALSSPFAGSASIQNLIREQHAAGVVAKDGAINVNLTAEEGALLATHAQGRINALEVSLAACTTDEQRKPYFGENSAWRALVKQIFPPA